MFYSFNRPGTATILLENGDRISFLPGTNEIDDNSWVKIAEIPSVKHFIKEGVLVVTQTPKSGPKEDPKSEPKPDAKTSARTAKAE